jgi:hypothetical protein
MEPDLKIAFFTVDYLGTTKGSVSGLAARIARFEGVLGRLRDKGTPQAK